MAKKRANGEGSIRKRSNGLWEARATVSRDPLTGRSVRKSMYAKTQAEARRTLAKLIRNIDSGRYIEPMKIQVAEWADQWLKLYCGHVKESTLHLYRSTCKNNIVPIIGHLKLSDVTPEVTARMFNHLLEVEKKAPSTLATIHRVMSSMFQTLVDLERIESNPCEKGKLYLPKKKPSKAQPMDDDKVKKFISILKGSDFENVCLLALFTGLRCSELLGLRWKDISFEKKTITVEKQLFRNVETKQYSLEDLKNNKPRMLCPPDVVFNILSVERELQEKRRMQAGKNWDDKGIPGLVFTTKHGRYIPHTTFRKHFKELANQAGMPDARIHDMRHYYTALALASGIDAKTVQEHLGHYSASFTLDRYAFVTSGMNHSHSQKLEQYIQNEFTD